MNKSPLNRLSPTDPVEIEKIVNGESNQPFSILGLHHLDHETIINVFIPKAQHVELITPMVSAVPLAFKQIRPQGFFQIILPYSHLTQKLTYQLKIDFGSSQQIIDDPYSFGTLLQDFDTWLLGLGNHYHAYKKLGAHLTRLGDFDGVLFAVWAPNAQRVAVVGDFNYWDNRVYPMRKRQESGIWELFIPLDLTGSVYKYEITDIQGQRVLKADPYAFQSEFRPNNGSKITPIPKVKKLLNSIPASKTFSQPISIYEVHLSSWQRDENHYFLNYREIAARLIPYVKQLGFTHIELMPITEHPFDASWGYQPIGLYAPTSRFGNPADLAFFIEQCHAANIGIILDWVPAHFPMDMHGLARFDGTALYEYADPREGFHKDWNSLIYNYSRLEVKNYLLSNLVYWIEQFGIDGFRFDAVTSMIHRDYSRKDGEWLPNQFGGRENLEAIAFIKQANQMIGENYPHVITIAEESSDFYGVTKPPYEHGLGFHYKWNMGWMHDTLDYFKLDPIYRKYHHDWITFAMLYAYKENYLLAISHDEVVYGKRSLLEKMPGDDWQKFANLRAFYGFMWGFPGKKLLFMGCEFAQRNEWNYETSLDFFLLNQKENNPHRHTQQLITDLNRCYRTYPALSELDMNPNGFSWLVVNDIQHSVYVFERKDKNDNTIIVVCNFTPVIHDHYRFGINKPGYYKEILNTDSAYYGGGNVGNLGHLLSEEIACNGFHDSLAIVLPPLSTLYLVWTKPKTKPKTNKAFIAK